MKYFLIFWFIIGSPFIFPYMALYEKQRSPEQRLSFFVYGAVALVAFASYIAAIVGTILVIL